MKRVLILVLILFTMVIVSGCGEDKKESEKPETYEIAMITDSAHIDKDTFGGSTWNAIRGFCEEYEMTCSNYTVPIDGESSEEEVIKESDKVVEEAIKKGGKVLFFAGSIFETAAHSAQKKHENTYFVLIDGVPRDEEHNYELAPNSTGVLFAEEESGYMAGYAAVKDGYRKLGFIGGKELPSIKRYGYGFLQGIAAAAKDTGAKDVELKYCYTDTFNEEDWITDGALGWYEAGTEVIFACGGSIGNSVVKAAEKTGTKEEPAGRMIGVDADQSQLSETVITSAKKEIKTSIYDILKTYMHDNFKGNSIFTYDLKNKGVSLEMTNARFKEFSNADYSQLTERIRKGEVTIEKETGERPLKDLAGEGITVEEAKFEKDK